MLALRSGDGLQHSGGAVPLFGRTPRPLPAFASRVACGAALRGGSAAPSPQTARQTTMMFPRIVPVSPTTMPALRSMVTRMLLPAVLPVLVIPLVPKMLTGVPDGKVNLGASLRAPLARRLAALPAVAGPPPSSSSSTASVARPPYAPRDGAARRARRSARLARPGRLRASPRTVAATLRASPVPASPRTALRTTPCSRVRISADTSARASGSVLRTTACGSVRTAARSRAAAAPLRRIPRRRFPKPQCCRFGRPDRRVALGLTPDASAMQTSRWLPMAAIGRLCPRSCTLPSTPVRSWHAGKSCHRSVARTTGRNPEICAVFQCVVDLSTDCHRLVFRPRLWYFLRATDRWHGQRHHMTATRRRRPSHPPFAPRAVCGPCGPSGA